MSAVRKDPNQLSRGFRLCEGDDPARRRWIVGLSLLGTAAGQLVGLFRTRIVRRLPDPPFGPAGSSLVDASACAYRRLHTPDTFLMIGGLRRHRGAGRAGGGRGRAQPARRRRAARPRPPAAPAR